jgi:hypothetical protein
MNSVSDEEIDNVKQQILFRIKQINEMVPYAKALSDKKPLILRLITYLKTPCGMSKLGTT